MPAFHTHWLVAIAAIEEEPTYIRSGYQAFAAQVNNFSASVHAYVRNTHRDDTRRAKKLGTHIKDAFSKLQASVAGSEAYDDITCFAAYMCGACGPDFWMCPSISWGGLIPDFAPIHFDLGHYNRTHRQFEIAIKRLECRNKDILQSKVEMSYFFGMATHVAADLVVHQLVNVSAGAYHFLEKKWENEHGLFTKDIFNTHNKVEQFWDSYVRFRYLGDVGPVFGAADETPWTIPGLSSLVQGFPTADGLKAFIEALDLSDDVKKAFNKQLDDDEVRINLELPLVFPRIFSDRLLRSRSDITPFIYRVVVDKSVGAYPKNDLHATLGKDASSEADEYQMNTGDGPDERRKAAFFSTELNDDGYRSIRLARSTSNSNYVTYISCPNLDRVRKYGPDAFYHLQSLEPFLQGAVKLARKFVTILRTGFDSNSTDLGELGCFWNLDTGTGLQVRSLPSDTSIEVITRLDFIHVFDLNGMGPVSYQRGWPAYIGTKPSAQFASGYHNEHPFKFVKPAKPFPDKLQVEESDSGAFVDKIRLDIPDAVLPTNRKISSFFDPLKDETCNAPSAWSDAMGGDNQCICIDLKHRLTLELRTAIADIESADRSQPKEKLGCFLWADEKRGLGDSCTEEIAEWLSKEHGKCIDYRETGTESEPEQTRNGLQFFASKLLMNLEKDSSNREIAKGKWNNVIPYDTYNRFLGRNFALGTGRKYTLKPTSSNTMNPLEDFAYYLNVAPTEQVFFTLFVLVATPMGVHELISHELVDQNKLNELKCIDCLGVNKIVLFYDLTSAGAAQVPECCIDNIENPVARAGDP